MFLESIEVIPFCLKLCSLLIQSPKYSATLLALYLQSWCLEHIMGTCFSHHKKHRRLCHLDYSHYNKHEDRVELHFLVEENKCLYQQNKTQEEGPYQSTIWTRQHIRGGTASSEDASCESASLEGEEGEEEAVCRRTDLGLVTLDVRALQLTDPVGFTPPSSVDLEWESDGYGALASVPAVYRRRPPSSTEESTLAEASPAESLEWDSCEPTDTDQLICEIERLTARALRETGGNWANR